MDPLRDLQAFRIPPRRLVVLRPGTWHAGPLFSTPAEMVFINLESRTTDDDDVTLLPVPAGRPCQLVEPPDWGELSGRVRTP